MRTIHKNVKKSQKGAKNGQKISKLKKKINRFSGSKLHQQIDIVG